MSGKTPAFQFYPNDWNRDMEEYPLEIQGAWIVILCKLWWSETRGEATRSLSEWARILREKKKKTEKILTFLEEKNVANINFLDNQNITITSRRMVKDFKISQIRQKVGKLGGNPKLLKKDEILDNQTGNQNLTPPSPTPSPTPINSLPKGKPPDGGHFSNRVGELFNAIKSSCETIHTLPQKNGTKFNPFQWVQQKANKNGHPQAIMETLDGIIQLWENINSPWSYSNKIFNTKNGKYNEKESIKESDEFKKYMATPEIKALIEKIG